MFGIELTDYDKKIYEEELADFLPDKIIDAHTHVWLPGMKRSKPKGSAAWTAKVAPDMTYEDLVQTQTDLYPGKSVTSVIMGSPTCFLDKVNAYVTEIMQKHSLPCLYCTNYNTTKEEILDAMAKGYIGIKPYLANCAPYIPANEVRIFDFLPHEHLELMNEIGGVVMLHVPRPQRLKDPVNLAQMVEIDERYPNAKVIIAHIGRAYVYDDIGDAFDVVKNTKNLYYDFSANVYGYAMERLIDAVGTKRIMFGSDMPYAKMRMYRIDDGGKYVNVVPRGLYGDVSADPHMRETDEENLTTFIYEELLALKGAAEKLGLTKDEVADLMYNTAAECYGIK
jgi:hypothetical protein